MTNGMTTLFLLFVAAMLLGLMALTSVAALMTRRYGYEYADQNPVMHLLDAARVGAGIGFAGCLLMAVLL